MWRRALRTLLPAAAVVWTLWVFGVELKRVHAPPPPPAHLAVRPDRWNLRSPQVAELADFLGETDLRLPAGSLITVAAPPLPGAQEFFLYLWHAYYLPRHDVVRASMPWTRKRADYLLCWGATAEELGLRETFPRPPEPVLRHPVGTVYRLPRP